MSLKSKIFASFLELFCEVNMADIPEIQEIPLPPIQQLMHDNKDLAEWMLIVTNILNKVIDKVNEP